jgi:hypothetical protein
MVHALRETWRVLEPDSLLIDLRPAVRHARIGLFRDRRPTIQWKMRESLGSYRAANRSLRLAEESGLLRRVHTSRFTCTTVFPSVEHLRDWLCDWYGADSAGDVDDQVRQVQAALAQPEYAGQLIAEVRFVLRGLTKLDVSPGIT